MRSAADARRELERRLARVDAFLAISEEEYNRVPADRHSCPARETLREIREWFKGELAIACRALGLPAAEVREKEAAYEFDCGYPRRQASIMALRDFLEACGRYDGKTREMVEGGAVLDISRRFLDETAMLRVAGLDMSTLRYTRPE
jgi:hypothetical protein